MLDRWSIFSMKRETFDFNDTTCDVQSLQSCLGFMLNYFWMMTPSSPCQEHHQSSMYLGPEPFLMMPMSIRPKHHHLLSPSKHIRQYPGSILRAMDQKDTVVTKVSTSRNHHRAIQQWLARHEPESTPGKKRQTYG